MFKFDISIKLKKKLKKLGKKDKILARTFKRKLTEVISHDEESINTYKNLKAPQNKFKRIHLTDNFILLFSVNSEKKQILFVDIMHWDYVYGKK